MKPRPKPPLAFDRGDWRNRFEYDDAVKEYWIALQSWYDAYYSQPAKRKLKNGKMIVLPSGRFGGLIFEVEE